MKILKWLIGLIFLLFLLSTPSWAETQKPIRVVTVTALIDGADEPSKVSKYFRDTFYTVSKIFRQEFNIELKLVGFNTGTWFPSDENFDGDAELRRLFDFRTTSDLVVAFTTKKFFSNGELEIDGEKTSARIQSGGLAFILGNYAIVRLQEKSELIFLHELGHIFGADHSPDLNSVMNIVAVSIAAFDKKSKEIILANRNRKF